MKKARKCKWMYQDVRLKQAKATVGSNTHLEKLWVKEFIHLTAITLILHRGPLK